MKKSLAGMMLAGATALTVAMPAFAKPVLLKVPVAFGTHLPALGTPIARVEKEIATVSGGQVKMKVYEPGKLVAPFEILDAVSSGKVNAGYTTAGYWAGKIPASPLF